MTHASAQYQFRIDYLRPAEVPTIPAGMFMSVRQGGGVYVVKASSLADACAEFTRVMGSAVDIVEIKCLDEEAE